jgi:hypothetical protein
MCQSRLHLVRSVTGPGKVLVEDIDGRRHEVSLLAPEPSEPEPAPGGGWSCTAATPSTGRLVLGPEEVDLARRSLHGIALAPVVTVGDTVSAHWDWACDRLTPVGLAFLQRCTEANEAAGNALPTPGSAAVCGL